MTRFKNIVRLLSVAMLLLLAAASATAQSVTVFAGQTFTFEVDVPGVPDDNIGWEIYNDFAGINMAVVPGNCPPANAFFPAGNTGAAVDITWLIPGIYMVKITAVNTCPTNNMKFYLVEVLPALPTATLEMNPGVICRGEDAELLITFTGDAPWSFVLESNDGINPPVLTTYSDISVNPLIIPISPLTTTTYRVTEITDINGTNTNPSGSVTITVNPKPGSSPIYQYDPLAKKK
jgi:hypothetical protein